MVEYLSDEHKVASRSTWIRELTDGTISTTKACIYLKGANAAIFNYSIPYNRYYVNGIETDTPIINKGDSFTGVDCYKESIEASYAMLMQCMGYADGTLGPFVGPIRSYCSSCDNNGIVACSITTKSEIKVEGASGTEVYFWEVAGASLVSGQGTDTIEINTTGLYSVNVDIRCTVTDTYTSTVRETTCLHKRTHNSIGDTYLVPHVALKPKPDLVPLTGDII